MKTVNRTGASVATSYSGPEEVANCLTHGAGLALSIFGLQQLVAAAGAHGASWQVAGCAVYGSSMVVLYLASCMYHAVQSAELKRKFRMLDHASIYLLIAGTYTPFLLALPQPWPTWGLATIWTLALSGIGFKLACGPRYERFSVVMYLAMGWLGIFAFRPLLERVTPLGVSWLVAGGLAYTVGTLFYVRHHVRYSHAIWHLFVVLGSGLHYVAVIFYIVPLTV
jgi:hemolysin III